MKQAYLFLFCCCFFAFSCKEEVKYRSLLNEDTLFVPVNKEVKLSELFSDQYKIIPLETKEESLIGRINKVVKFKDEYYVLSNDRMVFHFDRKGKFLSVLDKQGEGPAEYTYVGDFDVYDVQGKTEIWLCDFNSIKIYDGETLQYNRNIKYSQVINKFKRMQDGTILLMTGQGDKSITLSDEKGVVLADYLDREIPFLLFHSVQFVPNDSNFLFQLGLSNSYVLYSPQMRQFEKVLLSNDPTLLNEKKLLDLFDKHKQDFITGTYDYTCAYSIKSFRNKTWVDLNVKGRKYLTVLQPDQSKISVPYKTKGSITNDLFNLTDMSFLSTIAESDSPNSLLFVLNPDLFEESNNVLDENGSLLSISSEDNPCILEFY